MKTLTVIAAILIMIETTMAKQKHLQIGQAFSA